MVDEKTIKKWLAEIAEAITSNTAELERIRAKIAADKRRETALRALLDAETLSPALAATGPVGIDRHPIERGAMEVLKVVGKPIHVADLRRELIQRGVPIPGKGNDANVIVYLSRAPEISRVGKGLYALREWEMPQVPARRRRSPRRKPKVKGSK
jgi:hypothetical protein